MFWSKKEKTKETEKTAEIEPSWEEKCIAELKAFRGVGETFKYLGRTIIVTAHYALKQWDGFGYPEINPNLCGDYVDDKGEIHNRAFSYEEVEMLKKLNPGV